MFENGGKAWDFIEDHPVDIVVCDIKMPVLDGLSLASRVLERFPVTQVILITGHAEFELAQEAIRAGVTDYLLKPVKTDDLSNALRRARLELEMTQKKLSSTGTPSARAQAGRDLVKSINDYLYQNYQSEMTPSSVADHFGYSTDHLSRVLRERTGRSLSQSIAFVRIRVAQRLLCADRTTLLDNVADSVGYEDTAYFCRVFKRVTGLTPTEFRIRCSRQGE